METRIVNLEEKLAHLERYVGELDGVVRELNDRLDGYKRELNKMHAVIAQQGNAGNSAGGETDAGPSDQSFLDDKPPHW